MQCLIHPLLDENKLSALRLALLDDQANWQDGRKTAGSQAAAVKNNLQLDRRSELSQTKCSEVVDVLRSDLLIKSFSLPRKIHGVMFSRAGTGQGYGMHVDNAYMSTGRSDLSFTLFLTDPESYGGGELSVQSMQEVDQFKLPAGHILIYPSTYLHAVESVTYGERMVCVGWIQSYVKNNEDRAILFGIDAGARGLLARNGRTAELDLIFQAYGNLLRRLGD
ncbi:MAG: Fe2+-dependent dioxygenase [Prochlorococcus sp.]